MLRRVSHPLVLLVLLGSVSASAQSDALLEAVRVHREGVVDQARAELDQCVASKCQSAGSLTLLTAMLELSAGHPDVAADRLRNATVEKALKPFQAWYLGEAQSWSGQMTAAVKTLQGARKAAPPWLQQKIDRRLAELLVATGQAKKALPLLEADPDLTQRPEALFTRALAREATRQNARADWINLATRFPTHPAGRSAMARLADWKPTFEEALTRAQALWSGGDVAGALALIDALEPPSKSAKARVALVRGQVLLTRGRERDAEAQQNLAQAMEGPDWVAAQALNSSARRFMRLSDHARAREVFHTLDEKYPTDPAADDAAYLAAWLAMVSREFPVAISEFAAYEEHHPASKKRDEARWFRAFSHFRARQYADAREVLLSLVADFPRSSLVPQALYWAARSAQLSKQAADAGVPRPDVASEYHRVLGSFPGTFYGLLASERLAELGEDAPLPFALEPKQLVVKRPAALDLAATLTRAGLFSDAAQEIAAALQKMPADGALEWGHALQALGEYGPAHTIATRRLWGAVYAQHSPEAVALMYPRAFRPSVEKWSAEYGVDPALVWAIMRRESAFSPEVTSSADARGLLQLIPATLQGVLRGLKLPEEDPATLYSPDWNVRLGTWYLDALTDRLQHPTLVAGAYNGGPEAVVKWATERADEPLDQWVEAIPFKETRGYVKQVTVDLFIYRQLYGTGARQHLSLEVPKAIGAGVSF